MINQLTGYGGLFFGRIVNNLTDVPVAEAEVRINECNRTCITDNSGYFVFENVALESFSVSVSRWGYTPLDEADFTFDGQRQLEAEIRLLHPEMDLDPNVIDVDLMDGESDQVAIVVHNIGDGPLDFATSVRGARAEGELWDQIEAVHTGEILGDPRLQAVLFFQNHFWIVGGQQSDEPNMLYKLNRSWELVESFEQQSWSNYGWRNLTTDGQYLYGVDSTYIAQIDPQDAQVIGRIPVPLNPCQSLTWDPENELFWTASVTTDIFGIDRNGNVIHRIDNDYSFRTSGLCYFPDDPDGYKLYILSNDQDENVRLLKCETETGSLTDVITLPVGEGERSGGFQITDELYPFTWALMVQMQAGEDWVRTFEASSNFFWLDIVPRSSFLFPDEDMELQITLTAEDLEVDETYNAFIQIKHNTPVGGSFWIDVEMTVHGHSAPSVEQTPYTFGLTSIYPNPFNAIGNVSFALDKTCDVSLTLHDLTGRRISTLINGEMSGGSHNVPVNGLSLPSGMYIVSLSDGSRISQMKLTLLK